MVTPDPWSFSLIPPPLPQSPKEMKICQNVQLCVYVCTWVNVCGTRNRSRVRYDMCILNSINSTPAKDLELSIMQPHAQALCEKEHSMF